jgi:ATP-dependent Clp protease protease subunit
MENNYGKEFRNYATKHVGLSSTLVDDVVEHQIKSSFNLPSASLTPMILEERKMRATQMSVFDRLMMDRIIWVAHIIDTRVSSIIQAQLMFLNNLDKEKDITMHLDTGGGSVMAGLGIIDLMNYIDADVVTVNLGMCASMGSVLLGAGAKGKRNGLINSKVMTHQVSYGAQGNIQDVRITQKGAEQANFLLFKRLAKYTSQTLEQIMSVSTRDNWLNSDQAVEFGIMDSVIGLDKTPSITEQLEGFDEYYDKILAEQK